MFSFCILTLSSTHSLKLLQIKHLRKKAYEWKVKLEHQSSSRRKLHVQRVNKHLHSVLHRRKWVLQVNQAVNPTSEQVASSLTSSDISKSQAARQRKKMHQMEHLGSIILFYYAGTEMCDLRGIFLQIVFLHSSTKKSDSGNSDFFSSQSWIKLKHMHKQRFRFYFLSLTQTENMKVCTYTPAQKVQIIQQLKIYKYQKK